VHRPEPLNPHELQRLGLWERNIKRFHAAAIPVLLASAMAVLFWSDVAWLRRSLLVVVLALLVIATLLQLRERCPRCNARLRTTMLLRLRERCHYCGVPLRDQPIST
jgi:hypothetical protein